MMVRCCVLRSSCARASVAHRENQVYHQLSHEFNDVHPGLLIMYSSIELFNEAISSQTRISAALLRTTGEPDDRRTTQNNEHDTDWQKKTKTSAGDSSRTHEK
jgi:hypothetical protein